MSLKLFAFVMLAQSASCLTPSGAIRAKTNPQLLKVSWDANAAEDMIMIYSVQLDDGTSAPIPISGQCAQPNSVSACEAVIVVPPGPHTVTVRARNFQGESDKVLSFQVLAP